MNSFMKIENKTMTTQFQCIHIFSYFERYAWR